MEKVQTHETLKIKLNSDRTNKVRGFYILMTSGSVVCLPDDEYIIPTESKDVLKQKNIDFEVLRE